MQKRKDLIDKVNEYTGIDRERASIQVILEVLLDIRDLLNKENAKG